ncbi:hypothetical protein ACTZWW_12385 [Salinarimonas sp. NSM]|uniref:hypothetical protein n=1 Tax=Salinarimonas sp. NSM TaxID=3458003 RepID=UPI004035F2ED
MLFAHHRRTRRDVRRDESPEEIRARGIRELAALLEEIKAPRCPCAAPPRR